MANKKRRSKPTQRTQISNDKLSSYLQDFVPDSFQGSDRFLDIITWNIKFFNNRDPKRVENILNILRELNADIFVFQEIEVGAFDGIAEELIRSGAGLYKTAYGTTGGDQRVALMYDTEWVKASQTIAELYPENPQVSVEGVDKAVFPRLPLHSSFVAFREEEPFDFHLVGVHLKSQRGGGNEQRKEASKLLANWLQNQTIDEDVIIAGDWNSPTDRPEWQPFRQLESEGKVKFQSWNNVEDQSEASHLSASGRRTRLDLIVVTSSIPSTEGQTEATVINWNAFLENNNSPQLVREVIDTISDHLPVLTRFYFSDQD
jgi:endonuclease/exonuclease/phosphatase family metal-dependent hydrolase